MIHSVPFGLWLLNLFDGYFKDGVIDPRELLDLKIERDEKQDTIDSGVLHTRTGRFFARLFEDVESKFRRSIKDFCLLLNEKKTSCSCNKIINAIHSWDFRIFEENGLKVRNTIVQRTCEAVRIHFISYGIKPTCPKELFIGPWTKESYMIEWNYGIVPFLFLLNTYHRVLNHREKGYKDLSEWWLLHTQFTEEMIPNKHYIDLVFASDLKMWKEQFNQGALWSANWLANLTPNSPWFSEIHSSELINQNENLWTKTRPMYVYLTLDPSKGIQECKITFIHQDPEDPRLEKTFMKLFKKQAWNVHPMIFYKPVTLLMQFPFQETWMIRNDGLITILRTEEKKQILHVIGVLRSNRFMTDTSFRREIGLIPTENKHIC